MHPRCLPGGLFLYSCHGILASKSIGTICIGGNMEMAQSQVHTPDLFKLLAHDIRWSMLQMLARSDYSGQEFVRKLKLPQNLTSYHLRQLAEHGLVKERRSSADERSIYYSLDLEILRTRYFTSGGMLHPL